MAPEMIKTEVWDAFFGLDWGVGCFRDTLHFGSNVVLEKHDAQTRRLGCTQVGTYIGVQSDWPRFVPISTVNARGTLAISFSGFGTQSVALFEYGMPSDQ
jgi:hypothetical protein